MPCLPPYLPFLKISTLIYLGFSYNSTKLRTILTEGHNLRDFHTDPSSSSHPFNPITIDTIANNNSVDMLPPEVKREIDEFRSESAISFFHSLWRMDSITLI